MPRLCSDSSHSYTPQGGTILSPGRSVRQAVGNDSGPRGKVRNLLKIGTSLRLTISVRAIMDVYQIIS